jgi:hypothetical protein
MERGVVSTQIGGQRERPQLWLRGSATVSGRSVVTRVDPAARPLRAAGAARGPQDA